jgi:hypothetical protein
LAAVLGREKELLDFWLSGDFRPVSTSGFDRAEYFSVSIFI